LSAFKACLVWCSLFNRRLGAVCIVECDSLADDAPAITSPLVTGWIEDGTLAKSEAKRRRDGARRQFLCREIRLAFGGIAKTKLRKAPEHVRDAIS